MLKTMRRNVKALKPTLWIVIAIFVISIFAIWGGGGRLGESDTSRTLITVGKERISPDTYHQTLRQRLEAVKRQYPQLDLGTIEQLNVPQQVLQQIVEETLLLQIARDMKLGVTDGELRDKIVSYPVLQRDGRFIGFDEYKQLLEWNHLPLGEFEAGLKKEILVGKVVSLLTAGVAVSDEEVWENYRKQNESAKIDYLVIETGKIEIADKPDAAAIQAHFEKNKAAYTIPEKRTADYIFFKTDDLKKEIKVTDSEIDSYYRNNISQFRDPEQIKVSRIYLPFDGGDKAPVLAQAGDLAGKIRAGEDFADLARNFSKDDKAADGGDWGLTAWTSLTVKETDEIRKLLAGQVSDAIELEDGAAVIKVTEKTAEVTRPLAEVKTSITSILEDEVARRTAAEKVARIEKDARRRKNLNAAAKENGITAATSGPIGPGDPLGDVDPSGTISQALFTLKEKEISKPVQTYSGVGLVQLRTIEPSRPAKLEEVRDRVATDILDARKKEKSLEKINGVRASLTDNWDLAAKENSLELKSVETHRHGQYLSLVGENTEIDRLAFSLPIKEASSPVEFPGGYVIVRVLERQAAARTEYDKNKDAERTALLESQKSKFLQSYLVMARDARNVDINNDLFMTITTDVLNRFAGEE